MILPLAGIKVVEIGQNLAGPYAGEVLATLGADVVKVERPEGDDARSWGPPFWQGAAAIFQTVNRNKRSITLDLRDPACGTWLKDYLADVDVLLHNMRPGAMEELGLGGAALTAQHPRLVYASLSAFGHKGPRRLNPGYEPMVQAFAGIFSMNGAEDAPPTRVGVPILDMGTGLWLALGCVAALLRRARTGRGGIVDASLFETALAWLTVPFASFAVTGEVPKRHRTGSRRLVVFEAFETADSEVIIAAANDRLFQKLARALGRPDWIADERFKTNPLRLANKAALIPQIQAIIRQASSAHWVEHLEAAGVPCAPVQDLADVVVEPQTAALGMIEKLPGVELGLIGLPLSFDGERPPMRQRAPRLGEHNDELLIPTDVPLPGNKA
jgi:crotonobetainyl-CoA:carnitine CoA-transferase CaiB-like acyl-CoA transferase